MDSLLVAGVSVFLLVLGYVFYSRKVKQWIGVDDNKATTVDTNLADLEEYDSVSVLVIVTMLENKYEIKVYSSDFKNITTIGDLIKLIGLNYFE